jgi:adenylyl cyclase-associated protein
MQALEVLESFKAERKFLVVTTKAKKPDISSSQYMEILTDLQQHLGAVSDIRESNRGSKFSQHLSTVSEGITALFWVNFDSKPAAFVKDTLGSAQYYGNRILSQKYVSKKLYQGCFANFMKRCRSK